jgi:hypothetical protein
MKIIERPDDVTASTHRSMDMQITTAITAKRIRLELPSDEVLRTWTDKELRICLRNCERNGRLEEARKVVRVMDARGVARHENFKVFDWNYDTVCEVMRPFEEVALSVEDNQRKTFVDAGGFSRRAKDDPTRLWIDIYTAMKTPTMNAVFACHIKAPGDEATFVLELDGATYATYGLDRLAEALREWSELASDGPATIGRLAA